MLWQDFIFLIGSTLSIVFLAPTLRDRAARVPLGTSLPSMGIGLVYAFTFATLGMTFSAVGSFAAAAMWTLIATFRSPSPPSPTPTRRERIDLFTRDVARWLERRRSPHSLEEQYLLADPLPSASPERGERRSIAPEAAD
ncbi:hypothetical protein [Natrononativus amylolyticus]|uniref:hypothetical protein n=1 Tax=Natrononativus amylolyticus TaxID=2963434 RepID=UPI0020CBFF78|nr:hypothetical protein [Natrononativus amylolyticus]